MRARRYATIRAGRLQAIDDESEETMQVGITNPLRQFIGHSPYRPWAEEIDPLFCWDAHRVTVDGRVMLVVCNAANRFAGVTAMSGAHWNYLPAKVEELVGDAMRCAGFSSAAVEAYLRRAGAVELGRTHGRRAVAYMNKMIDTLKWCECDHDGQLQDFLMHVVNDEDFCRCATRDEYGLPSAWMAEDLRAIGIEPYERRRPRYSIDYTMESEGPAARADAADVLQASADTGAASPSGASRLTDEEAMRELDALIAELDAEEGSAFFEVDADRIASAIAELLDASSSGDRGRIEAATRKLEGLAGPSDPDGTAAADAGARFDAAEAAMLAERGRTEPHAEGCRVCGNQAPRVFISGDPYCLSCYNELVERVMGAPRVTNDQSTIAVFGAGGEMLQFAVERLASPLGAEWTAREVVGEDDPRREHGYEGVEVSTFADPMGNQDEALAELWEKAQQAVARPSTHTPEWQGGYISNGAHFGDEVRFANESGWGRISDDEDGRYIVVDGQRYTGEQFIELVGVYVGFDLRWEIVDRTDPLPE